MYVAVVFGAAELVGDVRRWRTAACAIGVLVAGGLMLTTRAQTRHWTETKALWVHALRVTDKNYVAHAYLGRLLMEAGDFRGAQADNVMAVSARPGIAEPHANLGVLFQRLENYEGARQSFERGPHDLEAGLGEEAFGSEVGVVVSGAPAVGARVGLDRRRSL